MECGEPQNNNKKLRHPENSLNANKESSTDNVHPQWTYKADGEETAQYANRAININSKETKTRDSKNNKNAVRALSTTSHFTTQRIIMTIQK